MEGNGGGPSGEIKAEQKMEPLTLAAMDSVWTLPTHCCPAATAMRPSANNAGSIAIVDDWKGGEARVERRENYSISYGMLCVDCDCMALQRCKFQIAPPIVFIILCISLSRRI